MSRESGQAKGWTQSGINHRPHGRSVALPAMDFTGRRPDQPAFSVPTELEMLLPADVRIRVAAAAAAKSAAGGFPIFGEAKPGDSEEDGSKKALGIYATGPRIKRKMTSTENIPNFYGTADRSMELPPNLDPNTSKERRQRLRKDKSSKGAGVEQTKIQPLTTEAIEAMTKLQSLTIHETTPPETGELLRFGRDGHSTKHASGPCKSGEGSKELEQLVRGDSSHYRDSKSPIRKHLMRATGPIDNPSQSHPVNDSKTPTSLEHDEARWPIGSGSEHKASRHTKRKDRTPKKQDENALYSPHLAKDIGHTNSGQKGELHPGDIGTASKLDDRSGCYKMLGISRRASLSQIEAVYKLLVRQQMH